MSRCIRYFLQSRVLGAVGLDETLVDAPGGLDRSVALVGEQSLETLGLGVGEQTGPGVQGAPVRQRRDGHADLGRPRCVGCAGPVEPVTCLAPPARDRPLDAAAALVELVSC